MLVNNFMKLACLGQLIHPAYALPAEQQPLNIHSHDKAQHVRAELKKAEIIPTVIDDFIPRLTLSITWPKQHANLGNTIKPKRLQTQPSISLKHLTPSTTSRLTYVVTLTDPDAPSRDNPKWSEMCHWIAANVSLAEKSMFKLDRDADEVSINKPDNVIDYKPPGPPPKTGKHRYVFIVFAPANGTTETLHLSKPGDRQHWGMGEEGGGVRDWARGNGLVPVAANFIYSKNKKQ